MQRIHLYLGIVPATCLTRGNRLPSWTDKDAAPGFLPFSEALSIGSLLEWVSLINFVTGLKILPFNPSYWAQ